MMGATIHGWVECNMVPAEYQKTWSGIITIGMLINRDYDSFGCLFGVRNERNFAPLALDRGLPVDVSIEVREDITDLPFLEVLNLPHSAIVEELASDPSNHASWISLPEIKAINLEDRALTVDRQVSKYWRNDDGSLTLVHRSFWDADFAQASGIDFNAIRQEGIRWAEGQSWEYGPYVFKAERMTRGEALKGWQMLFTLMAVLGEEYGDENVRLVVWFDS
jgi:hypothetical protein